MRLIVGCEYSGRVRNAFRELGHDAWSCDLLPSEDGSPYHIQGDVLELLKEKWDMGIFHPPCTHLAVSGARHFAAKQASGVQQAALEFVQRLLDADIPKIALENPVSIIASRIRPASQYIQPWEHGHGETKKTGLWLKGLPLLKPSNIVAGRADTIHKMPPGPDRWKNRSRTYPGVATAFAAQWGAV